jgi:hypothetical protein
MVPEPDLAPGFSPILGHVDAALKPSRGDVVGVQRIDVNRVSRFHLFGVDEGPRLPAILRSHDAVLLGAGKPKLGVGFALRDVADGDLLGTYRRPFGSTACREKESPFATNDEAAGLLSVHGDGLSERGPWRRNAAVDLGPRRSLVWRPPNAICSCGIDVGLRVRVDGHV